MKLDKILLAELPSVKAPAKLVLLTLVASAPKAIHIRELAAFGCMSVRSVRTHVNSLSSLGYAKALGGGFFIAVDHPSNDKSK